MKLVRCSLDKCGEPVYGYRINRDGIQFDLCRRCYEMMYMVFGDSEMKMGTYGEG